MSEDKRVIGNLPFFLFCFSSYIRSWRDSIKGGHTWILCARLALDANVAFTKWFYFLAVFKGVFEMTYVIKKHPSGNLDTISYYS